MRLNFFTIPAFDPEPATHELNTFLASHVVLHVDSELVQHGTNSAWTVCVSYVDKGEASKSAPSAKKGRVDYREVLSEADFTVYAKLRDLRKNLAESQGVPAYALFTNEQLAAMVTQRVTTKAALAKVDGVGEARIDKYADPFLRVSKAAFEGANEQA